MRLILLVHIRHATSTDAIAIARIHVDSWRATYRGIMPDELLDSLSYARREVQWQRDIARGDDTFVIVAEDEAGRLVGFADGGPERKGDRNYSGEVSALYVDPAHTGRGIGGRLLRAGASELRNRGHHSMLVWVLVENPACGFYEAMGGALLYEQMITIGGASLRARAYGWRLA